MTNPKSEELKPLKELVMPICPYCKKEMTPYKYTGYYEDFSYWDCDCETIKNETVWHGSYC